MNRIKYQISSIRGKEIACNNTHLQDTTSTLKKKKETKERKKRSLSCSSAPFVLKARQFLGFTLYRQRKCGWTQLKCVSSPVQSRVETASSSLNVFNDSWFMPWDTRRCQVIFEFQQVYRGIGVGNCRQVGQKNREARRPSSMLIDSWCGHVLWRGSIAKNVGVRSASMEEIRVANAQRHENYIFDGYTLDEEMYLGHRVLIPSILIILHFFFSFNSYQELFYI